MPKKLGVYICTGCTIGEAIDTAQLAKVATRECKAPTCRMHPFLCGPEGCDLIRKDVADGTVNTVVVAACSARAKTDAFTFDPGIVLERVNLREHVAWSQAAREEDTQMLAEDYLRMGVVKAQKSEPSEPLTEEVSRVLLVVGGGAAGITAALEAAAAGYEVVLVEKEPQLGGFAATLRKRFPIEAPYDAPAADGLALKAQEATYHSKIRVLTSARIVKIEGQPGMFDVAVEREGVASTVRVGAIVLATGWKPYDATRLAHLGYGLANVITNVELERMAARGPIVRPSDGRVPDRVLFLQCAGSRDPAHLSYCSAVCCMATLKHATYIHEQNGRAKVYIVYKDMRTPGLNERFYRAAQDHPLNFLTKGELASIAELPSKDLLVTLRDTMVGGEVSLEADLVVLATGMVPNSADGEAIRALKEAEAKAVRGETESQRAEAARRQDELRSHKGTEILHLAYRQGPDLPVLRHGFPESHFICFPYETRRTGIYAAGAVRSPMDTEHAERDALGAALKAIQAVELAAHGQAVHPRAGDLSFPSFLLQRCTQCKRCTEECPFGSLDEDEKGTPKPNPHRCRRCGICMGACPERIISFKNYSVDMVASMIKAIEVPEEDEEKPRIVVFMCENDAYPALDVAGFRRLRYHPSVRVIPLRCLGSLNIVWIADALSRGVDGVMLIGCKEGDDYECHFIRGSQLAKRRVENVKETLQRLRLEPERLHTAELSINEWDKLPAMIDEFAGRVCAMGANPYKGM